MSETTTIQAEHGVFFVCNNCGAYADCEGEEKIKHYKTCRQGESKKWEKHYADATEDFNDC